MLGQPLSMLIPEVVGFRLKGRLPEGATATDLVLTVTEMLRKKGVVGKFVEFFGAGLADLPLADRATIANMAPEYGATCGIFPVDAETLRYLRFTGRPEALVQLVEAYTKEQGLFHTADDAGGGLFGHAGAGPGHGRAEPGRPEAAAGPRAAGRREEVVRRRAARPAGKAKAKSANGDVDGPSPRRSAKARPSQPAALTRLTPAGTRRPRTCSTAPWSSRPSPAAPTRRNPSVMMAAGLLAKKAVEKGLQTKPWVKTSLAPGSKVVTDYLIEAGLMRSLEQLRFHLVGYGCTTCIGNSGPLPEAVSQGDRRRRPRRGGRAERQPQLRGPRPSRSAGQLPGLAAAGRRLRPGRPRGHRPAQRAARRRARTASRSTSRTSGRRSRRCRTPSPSRCVRRCSRRNTAKCSRATSTGSRCRCRRATCSAGTRNPPTSSIRRTSRA